MDARSSIALGSLCFPERVPGIHSCSVGHWRAMASQIFLQSAAGIENLRISPGASRHRGRIETCSPTLRQRRLDVLRPSPVFEQAVKLQYLMWAPEYGMAVMVFQSDRLDSIAYDADYSCRSILPSLPLRP